MEGCSVREEVSSDRAGGASDCMSHLRHLPFKCWNLNTAGRPHQSSRPLPGSSFGRYSVCSRDCAPAPEFFHF